MNESMPAPTPKDYTEAADERARLSYEGHKLPIIVILIWIAFFAFGLGYFVKHLT